MTKGFTLSEVLITLAIIGVVAAITMPTLINNYKHKTTITKLKKVYTVISQAYIKSLEDNGAPNLEEITALNDEEYFNKFWKPYFNGAKFCSKPADCGYDSKTPFSFRKGENTGSAAWYTGHRIVFLSNDGALYNIFTVTSENRLGNGIIIDINGSKGPNMYGIDVFYFQRLENKGIVGYGYTSSNDTIKSNCSKTGNGSYCAQYIISNGWEAPDDYPW